MINLRMLNNSRKFILLLIMIAVMSSVLTWNVSAASVVTVELDPPMLNSTDPDNEDTPSLVFGTAPTPVTVEIDEDAVYTPPGEDAEDVTLGKNYSVEVVSQNPKVADVSAFTTVEGVGTFNVIPMGKGSTKITVTITPNNTEHFKVKTVNLSVRVNAADTSYMVVGEEEYIVAVTTKTAYDNAEKEAMLVIDFDSETLKVFGADIAGYSLDGFKWYKLAISSSGDMIKIDDEVTDKEAALKAAILADESAGTSISKVLDKGGMKVQFATALDKKVTAAGAAVWQVGKISARPSNFKPKISYTKTGEDDNHWYLTGVPSSSSQPLIYTYSEDGKTMAEKMPNFWFDENYVSTITEGVDPAMLEEWDNAWQQYGKNDPPATGASGIRSDDPILGADETGYERLLPLDLIKGKQQKATYLAKLKPVVTAYDDTGAPIINFEGDDVPDVVKISIKPGSKTVKLKVNGVQKPPSIKVDYVKQLVTINKDMRYNYGNISSSTLNSTEKIVFTEKGDDIPFFVKTEGEGEGAITTTDDKKTTSKTTIPFFSGKIASDTVIPDGILDLFDRAKFDSDLAEGVSSPFPEEEYVGLEVYSAATAKKPRSEKARILIQNIRKFNVDDAEMLASGFDEGKYAYKLPKGYEFFDTAKNKWSTSLKVVSKTTTPIKVRLKSTSKYIKEFPYMTGMVGTSEATLEILDYGTYPVGQDETGKDIMSEKSGVKRIKVSYIDYSKTPDSTSGAYPTETIEIPEPENTTTPTDNTNNTETPSNSTT
jgi:hypothetical protein